jgi:hypothetical protein
MASIAETLFPDVLPYPETPIPYSPSGYTDYKNPLYKLPPPPSFGNYALLLAENKAKLLKAMRARGLRQEDQFLLMAMAMQESETLSEGERDSTKDKDDALSVNFSIFNLVGFFLRMAGATGDYKRLNSHAALPEVVGIIMANIKAMGLMRALQTIRGGGTAYLIDPTAYGAWAYPPALKRTISIMDGTPALLHNHQRVACNLPHV